MKLLGTLVVFWNLMFLLTLAVDADKRIVPGREALYDLFYMQEPCDANRVITPGQGGLRRYGFIWADPDQCVDSNKDCSIYMNVSSGYYITLRIEYVYIDCDYGLFQITGETGQPTPFCGFYTPSGSLYSSSNWLRYTLSTVTVPTCQSGISFYYTVYHTGECSPDEFRCSYDGRCIPNEVVCDLYDNCGDWSDETTAACEQITACGNTTYNDPSGVIRSPNYPGNYSNELSCDYNINASLSSSSIAIIFKTFDTDECCDYVTISCPTNSSHPSVRYSGSSLPQPFSIPWCSSGTVSFITDDSIVSRGFSLDYHISLGGCGDTVYTGSHGYVSSSNYPGNYGDNQNCSNIIWAGQRSSFSINFQYMNVEECCDFIEISCLDNTGSGSYRFTGTSIPPKLVIPGCTQALIWFYSDDTIVFNGFNLEYFVTPDLG